MDKDLKKTPPILTNIIISNNLGFQAKSFTKIDLVNGKISDTKI